LPIARCGSTLYGVICNLKGENIFIGFYWFTMHGITPFDQFEVHQ